MAPRVAIKRTHTLAGGGGWRKLYSSHGSVV